MQIRYRHILLPALVIAMMASGFSLSGVAGEKAKAGRHLVAEQALAPAVGAKGDLLLPRKS